MKKKYILFSIPIISIIVLLCFIIISKQKIKYIFLFIGDGMGSNQVELTEIYNNAIKTNTTNNQQMLSFSKFPTIGLRKNFSLSSYITDSAASATALASGKLTNNGLINIDENGNKIIPITYALKEKGYKIGIITNVPLNHATPAAFYANAENRYDYDTIAKNIIQSNFDYFAGGNFSLNQTNREALINELKNNNYNIITNKDELKSLKNNNKSILLSTTEYLPLAIDGSNEFNLVNYVQKGIEALDNKNGFFMMIESGNIDGAAHNNDAKSIIYEINELDNAVQIALKFAEKHKNETLIIVTGDHETGGLTLGNKFLPYYLNLDSLYNQKKNLGILDWYTNEIINNNMTYEELINNLKIDYGINNENDLQLIKSNYDEIKNGNINILKQSVTDIINNNAGINFSTNYHTGERIPVYTFGKYNEIFSGIYSSEDFNKKLKKVLNIKN